MMNRTVASILAVTLIGFSPLAGLLVPAQAQGVDKEVSLVTRQPMGELAVAGRLSVDLHTEFMLSRSFGTEAALNWYNCGYSGGGRGGTTVGGNFGDFGFQVPYQDREQRYPHAVLIGHVRAVHFDGDDFFASNIPVEPKILDSGKMAVEVWFRTGIGAGVLLGWQSRDGLESSAPVGVPPGAGGSVQWQHLVVNCNGTQEDWYLNGLKIASGQRRTLPKAGHVMLLGGASAAVPSFKGELVAVRLHDEAMSLEEITHNFKGGIALGTEIHDWWRTEPGQWWVKESKHFRHCVDKKEMEVWTEQQRDEFHQRVPGMFDLAELIYHVYSERLAMRSSVVSVKPEERGDGIKYSVPIQPADGSWMGFDGHFGWALQGAGEINPHELVHGWQAMTGGMAGNYWETHADFPQTYAGIYQGMPIVMRESSLFPANGRTYYHDRAMFEHLAQMPEYGPMFIAKLWYDGPSEPKESPYPWVSFQRVNPIPGKTLADEYARMVMRNVTWDFKTFKECNSLASFGNGPQESPENRYLKEAGQYRTDALQTLDRSRVVLQQIPHDPQWWRVPKEQAPQQLGWNLCPLSCKSGRVSAMLAGYVDGKRGGDWRAGLVGVDARGKPVYGEVFGPGRESVFVVSPGIKELYLAVAATPSNIVDIPMTGDYRSFEQEQFPYRVKLTGCVPLDVMIRKKPGVAGRTHANGGGFVETSAQVAATAFVGRQAMVLGNSKVMGQARIEDHAVVRDATVKDRAVVSGHALVCEQAVVAENAKVRDFAVVRGQTTVSGNAKVLEHALIDTRKTCSGNVVIKGVPYVYGGNQSGSAMIDGFYAKNNEVTGGKWFTWSWGQGKNPGEEEKSFGGLYADYDFDQEHGWMARDAFGATWGYLNNGAQIEPGKGRFSGADGALRLNGKNQFVELQKDVADMSECTYTAEINWDGARDGERIFEFSNASGDLVFLSPSLGGTLVFAIRKDNRVEEVKGPALARNVWTTVQVICNGSGVILIVDGAKVAERAMSLRPDSVRADRAYLGCGIKGDYFGGLIGRFTVHAAALIDRTPPTPNPPVFKLAPLFTSPGSLVMTAQAGSDPLDVVEYWFEEVGGRWSSGWTTNITVRIDGRSTAVPASYRFKMRDKGGNETCFSKVARATGFDGKTRIVKVNGAVPAVVEAEHFIAATASPNGSCAWEEQTEPQGFVGKGFMVVPDCGALNDPFDASAARLDYALQFTKPGRYFLWVRASGNNDGGQSIHAGLDLTVADWGRNLSTGYGRFGWSRSPEFEVLQPGIYLFSIWMREDGAMVDRFLITSDERYEPPPSERGPENVMTGRGPAESAPLPRGISFDDMTPAQGSSISRFKELILPTMSRGLCCRNFLRNLNHNLLLGEGQLQPYGEGVYDYA